MIQISSNLLENWPSEVTVILLLSRIYDPYCIRFGVVTITNEETARTRDLNSLQRISSTQRKIQTSQEQCLYTFDAGFLTTLKGDKNQVFQTGKLYNVDVFYHLTNGSELSFFVYLKSINNFVFCICYCSRNCNKHSIYRGITNNNDLNK